MVSAPPGSLIDIGTGRLHLRCMGEGSPAVVFDAALGASSISWSLVQPGIARVTRACSYDRAGFGWSEAGPLPRTAGRIADELHELLRRAGVLPPYVLVGHSFGGLVMRLYASRHPHETAALVLIEPAIPEQWADPTEEHRELLARAVRMCGYGATAARFGVATLVTALARLGALGIARALARAVSRGGLRRMDEDILAPMSKLPPDARWLVPRMWSQPKFFEALGSQIESIGTSSMEVLREAPADYGELPVIVISGSRSDDWRREMDATFAGLSTRGHHVVAADSGHWVPLDAPQPVIDAILAIVSQLRQSRGRHDESRS